MGAFVNGDSDWLDRDDLWSDLHASLDINSDSWQVDSLWSYLDADLLGDGDGGDSLVFWFDLDTLGRLILYNVYFNSLRFYIHTAGSLYISGWNNYLFTVCIYTLV